MLFCFDLKASGSEDLPSPCLKPNHPSCTGGLDRLNWSYYRVLQERLDLSETFKRVPNRFGGMRDLAFFAVIFGIRIRLHLVKHLRIKMSEKSLTQRFDDSMSSLSSEKRIKNFTA